MNSEDARARVQRYIDMRRAKPFRLLDDDIHAIHGGTEWEAVLNLSDLEAALATAPKPSAPAIDATAEDGEPFAALPVQP